MRPIFSISLFLVFIQGACFAQQDKANRNDSAKIIGAERRLYDLVVNEKSASTARFPFSKVSFNDVRYDTSFIAINWQASNNSLSESAMNKKYNLTGGLAPGLTNYINQYFSNNFSGSGAALVCYIKRFAFALKDTSLEFFSPQERINNQKTNIINVEIECYYKAGNSLFPAFRIDTAYESLLVKIKKDFPAVIKDVISPLMERISNVDTGRVLKRKSYTEGQIADRYQARFNLPILTANPGKRGIYKSFEEFKNNAPSITEFNIKTEKIRVNSAPVKTYDASSLLSSAMERRNTTVYLYDANGELISPVKIFGFCDDSGYWIQHGAFYYPLIRVGNAFEFMFMYHYADANYHTHSEEILFPLNMENGHIE